VHLQHDTLLVPQLRTWATPSEAQAQGAVGIGDESCSSAQPQIHATKRRKGGWAPSRRSSLSAVAAAVLCVAAGAVWLYWGSLLLRLHLLPGSVARAALYCASGSTEVTDPSLVGRLRTAAARGRWECDYPTRCLSDTPEAWRLVFIDRFGRAFEVQLAVDDCNVFYCPSLGRTYRDRGRLEELARQAARQAGLIPPLG
jgi:hypothetical protein